MPGTTINKSVIEYISEKVSKEEIIKSTRIAAEKVSIRADEYISCLNRRFKKGMFVPLEEINEARSNLISAIETLVFLESLLGVQCDIFTVAKEKTNVYIEINTLSIIRSRADEISEAMRLMQKSLAVFNNRAARTQEEGLYLASKSFARSWNDNCRAFVDIMKLSKSVFGKLVELGGQND